jgi:hypothetical protein
VCFVAESIELQAKAAAVVVDDQDDVDVNDKRASKGIVQRLHALNRHRIAHDFVRVLCACVQRRRKRRATPRMRRAAARPLSLLLLLLLLLLRQTATASANCSTGELAAPHVRNVEWQLLC